MALSPKSFERAEGEESSPAEPSYPPGDSSKRQSFGDELFPHHCYLSWDAEEACLSFLDALAKAPDSHQTFQSEAPKKGIISTQNTDMIPSQEPPVQEPDKDISGIDVPSAANMF